MIFWTEMPLRPYAGKWKYFECFLFFSLSFFKRTVLITKMVLFTFVQTNYVRSLLTNGHSDLSLLIKKGKILIFSIAIEIALS